MNPGVSEAHTNLGQRHRSLEGFNNAGMGPVARSGGVTVTLAAGGGGTSSGEKRGPFARSVSLTFPAASEGSPTKVVTSYTRQVSTLTLCTALHSHVVCMCVCVCEL